MRAMSSVVVARVVGSTAAAGAEVPRGARGARPAGRAFPKTKLTLVVVALLALAAFTALIAASQAPNADHSYNSAGSTADLSGAGAPVSEPAAPQMSGEEALDAYGKLPLSFIPNEGQTEEAVRYYAQGAGYGFFFTPKGAMLSLAEGKGHGDHALALSFLGAEPDATLEARQRLSGEVNYLVGDDPAKWQHGLPTHAELLYGGLWPGIDMAVRGDGGKLKYEFHLQPGSSVEDVHLAYRGAEGLSVGAGGELLVQTPLGVLKDAAPVSYQRIAGERVAVESRYTLTGDGGYGFAVGAYDPRYPLVIDPGLDYSSFLGGTRFEDSFDIAVDGNGRAYVTGSTSSSNFPTNTGAFDRTLGGFNDAFVTKLNASGSAPVYSTYLGGGGQDEGHGIAVRGGRAYVTGWTESSNFRTTSGAFDRTFNGAQDAFVTKLNASGSALAYSTYLGGAPDDLGIGGSDEGDDIAVDADDRAYVTGSTSSSNFRTTSGAFDRTFNGAQDAFVTKLNASGSALAYSTYLGGGDIDQGHGIAVDGTGRAHVIGTTSSADYPTTAGAFDTSLDSVLTDAFVTKLNASGSAPIYSTYLGGGGGDFGRGIAVDATGRAYVTGITASSDYPTTTGAFDTSLNGREDAFVTKLNALGSVPVYSTFLGGAADDFGRGIAADGTGRAYVTGQTFSSDYPTTAGAFDTNFSGPSDAFVTKLPTG